MKCEQQQFSLSSLMHHQWMLPMIVFFTHLKGESLDWEKEFQKSEIQKWLQEFFYFVSILDLEGFLSKEEWEMFCTFHSHLQCSIHYYGLHSEDVYFEELNIPQLCKLMIKIVNRIKC